MQFLRTVLLALVVAAATAAAKLRGFEVTEPPTEGPSQGPSQIPTEFPTFSEVPTEAPTLSEAPTHAPTLSLAPTDAPTVKPTRLPTVVPTTKPTRVPTTTPTDKPTVEPTWSLAPSTAPTIKPTRTPTVVPTTKPTRLPTTEPTIKPTRVPTIVPTTVPSVSLPPTEAPTIAPTNLPTVVPTTTVPTITPTITPTKTPTITPTIKPTIKPTIAPTKLPTVVPTITPTVTPTVSIVPTIVPTIKPTVVPTITPTWSPTALPSIVPTVVPTVVPTIVPTDLPTVVPTITPTATPTVSLNPTIKPTITPTVVPTKSPTQKPTVSRQPTVVPTSAPTTAYTHGFINAIAGVGGSRGFSGNNGPGTSARVNQPGRAVVDTSGNVYFHDTENYLIRKVTASTGFIKYIVGKQVTSGAWDPAWEGFPGTSVLLTDNEPFSCMTIDTNGYLYFSHTYSNRIMRLDTDYKVYTFLGNGNAADAGDGSAATDAGMSMNMPWSFWLDSNGQTYIAGEGDVVRKIDASGIIDAYAGSTYGFSGDGGPPLMAAFKNPHRVHGDSVGNIFIRDYGNNRIRYVNPSGIVGTYLGNGNLNYNGENVPRTSAQIGSATSAASWVDMAVDETTGDLIYSDTYQFRVRIVSKSTGLVRTIAGNGNKLPPSNSNGGNGGKATSATLFGPESVYFQSGSGRVIFGDYSQLLYIY